MEKIYEPPNKTETSSSFSLRKVAEQPYLQDYVFSDLIH